MSLLTRFRNGWNAFNGRDPTKNQRYEYLPASYTRPDRVTLTRGNERSIVNAVYNRIANDAAQIRLVHAKLDKNGKYLEPVESGLNYCLSDEANIDQTGRAFILDLVLSMFDEGVVAAVPVDTTINPDVTDSYDIKTMRTGKILEWFPDRVRVRLYDDRDGTKKDIVCPKDSIAIIENPFYTVMNEPNSTAKRLIRKLNLIDIMDEQSSSGKLDLIIQLPYIVKTEARRQQAENRRRDIERQLTGSKYGIAYTDGTEHITQLNRPVENTLASQVSDLKADLYSQLGITQAILDGSASEQELLNYYSRTVEPILAAIADEFKRKFLSKNARSRNQSVWFFRDPFKLVPVDKVADIADKFTRNEILSSNEVRAIVGYQPVDDPAANELRNKNLNQAKDAATNPAVVSDADEENNTT
jgi:hypothetical protein